MSGLPQDRTESLNVFFCVSISDFPVFRLPIRPGQYSENFESVENYSLKIRKCKQLVGMPLPLGRVLQ